MDASLPNAEEDEVRVLFAPLIRSWRTLVACTVLAGALTLGVTFAIPPTFTAQTSFVPPQQQSSNASALASLGALASLAGGSGALKNPTEQYISLMQSVTVSDRIIDRFDLMHVYDSKLRSSARRSLADNVRIIAGKKDGLIYVEVDDHDPKRAADIANRYIEELRRMASNLALTEAQQRRAFFETQLKQTRDRLAAAQQSLENSGFGAGDLQSEPRAAADAYARLKAEQTSAEIRLRALGTTMAESSPEVQRIRATLVALQAQIAKLEDDGSHHPQQQNGYISKYRDYKYEQELFEIFARQYELAKSDEARDGALIQVIDPAMPPDRKSRPRRALTSVGGAIGGLFAAMIVIALRNRRTPKPSHAV